MSWTDDDLLAAVRRCLSASSPRSPWQFLGAEVVGRAVRVVFTLRRDERLGRHEPGAFAVDYTLTDLPEGANTGEVCDTPYEWAEEVWLDIEEEVATGGVWRAERSVGPDRVVLLRWQRWIHG